MGRSLVGIGTRDAAGSMAERGTRWRPESAPFLSVSSQEKGKDIRAIHEPEGSVMSAMMPGNQIDVSVAIPQRCEKCHARFVYSPHFRRARIDEKWCQSCNDDPTTDLIEDEYWSKFPTQAYIFAGWKFRVYEKRDDPDMIVLNLYKKLPYPEDPVKVLSAAWGNESEKPRLAAWLIGHWYEHLFQICPCLHGIRDQQVDEGDGSNFRKAVIESLLSYHECGLV